MGDTPLTKHMLTKMSSVIYLTSYGISLASRKCGSDFKYMIFQSVVFMDILPIYHQFKATGLHWCHVCH